MRAASPSYVFDAQQTYNLQPLLFEAVTAETGASVAHDATNRCALMTFSSTPTGGKAYMQSYEWHRYQPGRCQTVFITGNFIEHKANVKKWLMYGDGNDGIAIESNGTGYQFVLYSTTDEGDQTVTQENWNVDKLDGTGKSGLTLNIAKGMIFFIDFQALYYGRVRIGLDIDGQVVVAHEFNNANSLAKPYIANANLPISAGMTCTGTVSTTMNFTCCSVISEGGQEDIGGFNFSQEGTVTASSGARTHLLSVRPKATFNSIANRSKFVLNQVDIAVTGTNPVKWELVLGQTITGAPLTYIDVNATYSGCEYNIDGALSGDPGIVLDSGYVASSATQRGVSSSKINMKYPITLNAAGAARTMGTLTLLVTGIGGTSACRGIINWREIR